MRTMRRSWTRNPSSDTVEFLSLRRGCGYRSAVPAAQQKKQKEIRKFQNSLAEGAKVVTGGGIFGTVKRVDLTANTVDVEISRGVVVTVDKGYVFADPSSQMPNA